MKPEEICKIVCAEGDFYKRCPIYADSDICVTLRSCQDISNHYETVIIPAKIAEAKKELLGKIFHEFFEGELSGWVACCVDENCQKICLWHDLEKLEQQLKKDMGV